VFARAVDNDAEIQAVLKEAILFSIDCEKGEGIELAKKYKVSGYPTFAMINAQGDQTDRWIGYGGPENWAGNVREGLADRRTIVEKQQAYSKEPTLALSRSLARHAAASGEHKDAVTYFRKARDLDAAAAAEYTNEILSTMYYGMRSEAFTFEDVEVEAKGVMASSSATAEDKVEVALMILSVAKSTGQDEKAVPYITEALAASEGTTDESVMDGRHFLQIDHALLVEKDGPKAVALRRQVLPEGWDEDPVQLNRFAWWCFENNVNLEEAEALALKGFELADNDKQRANILDTAAEICNARGNCEEAIARIKQAIDLDPDKQYFKDQLARFEQAKEDKNSG